MPTVAGGGGQEGGGVGVGGSRVGAAAAKVVAGGGVKLDTLRNETQLEQCATWRYILNSTTVN